MKNILVIGASSDLIVELIKIINSSSNDLCITLLSSCLSTEDKFSFLKCKFQFYKINYDCDFKTQLSKIIKSKKFDDIYIPNGYLPVSNSIDEINKSLHINYSLPHIFIRLIIDHNKNEKMRIITFSSPASDRPRKSNFIYGSHKGALDFMIKGLRLKYPNISFVIIKPGPTNTKMTRNYLGFKHNKNTVAKSVYWQLSLGLENIYAPLYWRVIMIIILLIPNKIFKHLKI